MSSQMHCCFDDAKEKKNWVFFFTEGLARELDFRRANTRMPAQLLLGEETYRLEQCGSEMAALLGEKRFFWVFWGH